MHAFPLQGSGEITYDELCEVVRHKLRVSSTAMPDNAIKALWCALDADDSNQLTPEEMGAFFKRGEGNRKAAPKAIVREHTTANLTGSSTPACHTP